MGFGIRSQTGSYAFDIRQKLCNLGYQYSTVQNKKVILKTYGKSQKYLTT